MPVAVNVIRVARAFAQVPEHRFVFVGASILPLLLNDPAAPPPRPTIDVDAAVQVLSYSQWERLQDRVRGCGVVVRANPAVGKGRLCLFHLDDIEVDIMPVRLPPILPPSRMLELGYETAEVHQVAEDVELLALSAPGLLATKLEAFQDRGARDPAMSKDLEDVVALLDRRLGIAGEVAEAHIEMRYFIAGSLQRLLHDGHVLDVLADLLRDQARERRALALMRGLSAVSR
jgi:predicted nucleotidyltransferase